MSDVSIALDSYCLAILNELQRDSRQTLQQISEAVGLSSTPCWRRIRDMEQQGVIRGYSARVDREKVGLKLSALVELNLDRHSEAQVRHFEEVVAQTPQILRCVSVAGAADYILTVLMPDIQHYEQFLHDTFFRIPGVTHVRSSIVLRDIKSGDTLPIDQVAPLDAKRQVRR